MEKKVYTKEFKLGAARMVVDERKKALHVARDLGVASSSLTKWIRSYRKHGVGAFPGKGMLAPVDQEKRDLERRLRRAEMERDLLKKTIAFFAELDRKNTAP
jgi:transposase